ncbi:MAG: ECF transporter S component [Eubacteriales bacterium]|nr:ECF transporter S component [Eubacteriales bacterium]
MRTEKKTLRLTSMGLLSALVAVLALLGNFIKIGPFPITLTLTPIIIGGALFGPLSGAILGFIFGLVTLITGMLGWDGGGVLAMFSANPVMLVVLCIGKAVAAGYVGGLVYKALSGKVNPTLAVIISGIATPVTNTGVFLIGMFTVFSEMLKAWAGGTNVLTYAITGLVGVNFLMEVFINLILATSVTFIIRYAARYNK